MENPENENENIPMELSVASVASAAMAVMPEEPVEFGVDAGAAGAAAAPRKIKPRPKRAAAVVAATADPNAIARMKKDLEEGRRRLKPEEINNPFIK